MGAETVGQRLEVMAMARWEYGNASVWHVLDACA